MWNMASCAPCAASCTGPGGSAAPPRGEQADQPEHFETSAESLNSDLVGKIFYHMLNGPKDTQGFEVAGMYALSFEERPVIAEADMSAVTAAFGRCSYRGLV